MQEKEDTSEIHALVIKLSYVLGINGRPIYFSPRALASTNSLVHRASWRNKCRKFP
jgi:hypothetical protein